MLQQGDKAYSHSFQTQVPLQEDGYPALVRALRKGWLQEITKLVQQIDQAVAHKPE